MAEIVNLRRVKKARARQEQAAQAAENRVRHGRTKSERAADAATSTRDARTLDQARLQPDGKPRE